MRNEIIIRTHNFIKADTFIDELVKRNGFGAVIGEKGAGKTFMLRKLIGAMAEKKNHYRVVEVEPMTEGSRNITSIMSALVEDISGESPRRDIEARRRQLKRILAERVDSMKLVLAIDEAQDLHKSTLRGLKKLHELGFGMRDRLFTIVLFGQNNLKDRIADDELRPRVKRILLAKLTEAEQLKFVDNADHFTKKGLDLFLENTQKTPLSVANSYGDLRDIQLEAGLGKIDENLVNDYFTADVREYLQSIDKSTRKMASDIELKTGEKISPASISLYKRGKLTGDLSRVNKLLLKYKNISQNESKASV